MFQSPRKLLHKNVAYLKNNRERRNLPERAEIVTENGLPERHGSREQENYQFIASAFYFC